LIHLKTIRPCRTAAIATPWTFRENPLHNHVTAGASTEPIRGNCATDLSIEHDAPARLDSTANDRSVAVVGGASEETPVSSNVVAAKIDIEANTLAMLNNLRIIRNQLRSRRPPHSASMPQHFAAVELRPVMARAFRSNFGSAHQVILTEDPDRPLVFHDRQTAYLRASVSSGKSRMVAVVSSPSPNWEELPAGSLQTNRSEHRGTAGASPTMVCRIQRGHSACLVLHRWSFPWHLEGAWRSELPGVMREASVSVMRDRPHHLISGSVAFDRDHNPASAGCEAGPVGSI
jgi:hypothetical protein